MIRVRTPLLGTLALAALAACADTPSDPNAARPLDAPRFRAAEDAVKPGEVLVGYKEGTDGARLSRLVGATNVIDGYAGKFQIMTIEPGQEYEVAARLRQDPNVAWAEPNYIRQVDAIDSRLWAFYNPGGLNMKFSDPTDSRYGTYIPSSYASTTDADEDAIEGIASGGGAVVISSIDTGVDYGHPEFSGRLIRGCDWYQMAATGQNGNNGKNCTDTSSDDTPDEGHGTHTTGTMAGTTVGVAGITGAGSNVRVLVQRVCGSAGCYTSGIVNAIYAAADYPGMVAMNLSLGGRTESTAEKNAISYATSKGVLVIAAA
jgi:subtilisin family serine protease